MNCLNCCSDRNEFLASDNVCGNFSFACGEPNFPVWDTNEVIPVGTVSILYTSGCANALIVNVTDSIGNTDAFEVPLRNTRSRTFANLVSVSLTCPESGSNNCEGRFCLNLHYLAQMG
ncbi:S-Ena type endospore appendage [Virgibacillus pantothenticus]|uniref:DUF3992 domain-containing protein n=1 Tax=Virgibacillus pantothenticus TaxID=1473 RepID=UPI0009861970